MDEKSQQASQRELNGGRLLMSRWPVWLLVIGVAAFCIGMVVWASGIKLSHYPPRLFPIPDSVTVEQGIASSKHKQRIVSAALGLTGGMMVLSGLASITVASLFSVWKTVRMLVGTIQSRWHSS
jgi:hypothetical protein